MQEAYPLLPILRQAFPEANSYEILATVVQSNAKGYRLLVDSNSSNNNNNNNKTEDVFVKLVTADHYSNKSWPDCRRTLTYIRTEVRFYNEFVPELLLKRRPVFLNDAAVPKIYYAGYDLEGFIAEDEPATDPTAPAPTTKLWTVATNANTTNSNVSMSEGRGGVILMESIGDPYYFQESPIRLDQAKQTLSAAAALHASAWEDVELLTKAQLRLSRGSYHLKTRNVKELAELQHSWEHFSSHFSLLDPELFRNTNDIGRRIQALAEYISEELSPSAVSAYATLSHGDFKSMNCFLSNDGSRTVKLVDFASTGVGLGMSDVAMHIHHAVLPEDLKNGGEEMLLDHYLAELNQLLGPSSGRHYPKTVAMRHYRFAVVDYFRFFLGRFWKSATLESFAKKKDSKNTALVNRNVDAALVFLDRAHKYLLEIEAEYEASRGTQNN